ncbi:MAG: DUF1848 domain-containing protein [Erysipelotrichia bacterium]|nr:DUF1848 domain-containing protein [Erysipelotrichia bacterium]
MIVSASRRTDIPAYYSDWFYRRLSEGFALIRNPINPHQVSKVLLDPQNVECFVFWTKYPAQFMKRLDRLSCYKYYFQFTLTPYGSDIETNIPPKKLIIDTFKQLSDKIGPNRVVWRYDPIIFNAKSLNLDYHVEHFENLCKSLSGFTRKCVISFYDNYKFAARRCRELEIVEIDLATIERLGSHFAEIAKNYDLIVETCAESVDLAKYGIMHGKCVDDRLVSEILGYKVSAARDKGQRKFCGCVKSVDIGAYSTCPGKCLYCYATRNHDAAAKLYPHHNPDSPLLLGELTAEDRITVKKSEKLRPNQPKLPL